MYLDYFQLERHPFRITPDTSLFYSGGIRGRGVVLDAMLYAIETGEGILKVVGEVGSGKTMLCRMLEEKLPETTEVVYLANPKLSAQEILYAIAFELKLPIRPDTSKLLVMQQLQTYLLKQHAENRKVLVVIEEAQGMPLETLEEIRLFSNLETHRDKLLQIILFGQPELDKNLSGKEIRQLRERITHSFYLPPLSADETGDYIRFRLGAAGCPSPKLFTGGAERLIARASGGLTRRINILADKALLAAFADNVLASPENLSADVPPVVTWRHALAAIRDSDYGFSPIKLLAYPIRTLASGVALVLATAGYMSWPYIESRVGLVNSAALEPAPDLAMAPVAILQDAAAAIEIAVPAELETHVAVETGAVVEASAVAVADYAAPVSPIPTASADETLPAAFAEADAPARLEIPVDELAEGAVIAAAPEIQANTVSGAETGVAHTPVSDINPAGEMQAVASPAVAVRNQPEIESFAAGEGEISFQVKQPAIESTASLSQEAPPVAPAFDKIDPAAETESVVASVKTPEPQRQGRGLSFANSNHVRDRVLASIDWLDGADRAGYTVQFLSGSNSDLEFAELFFERLDQAGLLEESYLCMSVIDGESYWTIKHGNFAGLSVGQRFINQLPGDLYDYKPFVQNMSSVECNTNHSLAALITE